MGAAVITRWTTAKRTPAWQHVHDVADRAMGRYKRLSLAAFTAGRRAINKGALRHALTLKNRHAVEEAMAGPIEAMIASLRGSLPQALQDVRDATAKLTMGKLGASIPMRATAARPIGLGEPVFDATNPDAIKWVEEHAAETIDGISEDTKAKIRDLIERAFVEQFDVDELALEIADLIGDETRAELIAVTETMRASNEGQQEAWRQAEDQGLLIGNEKQEWIVTPDDLLCPICKAIGKLAPVGLDEPFVHPQYGTFDGPPAHPRCRCTVGLVLRNE